MPELDVSEVLLDPDIADSFTVTRRTEVVSAVDGRSTLTTEVFNDVFGVVIVSDPSDNDRNEDSQIASRVINVVSQFRFRSAAPGFQPDVITWAGGDYTVKGIKHHTRYGAGFVKVVAHAMSASTPDPV